MRDSVYRLPYEGGGRDISDAAEAILSLDSPEDTPADAPDDEGTEDDALPPDEEPTETPDGDEDGDESEDSDDPDDVDDEGDEEPELFTVKVDGKEEKVTLDEALRGYSRTQNYTRDKQKLAEERRAFEAERAQTVEQREQYAQKLRDAETLLTELLPAEPDWDEVRRRDPRGYANRYADYQRQRERLEAVRTERQQVEAQQHADFMAQLSERVTEERQKLVERVPEWSDPEAFNAGRQKLAAYAKDTYGFTDEDLGHVYDHRVMDLMRKAMLYDELTSQPKPKPTKGTRLRPGGRATTPRKGDRGAKDAMARLRKSGSVDDAAEAMMRFIDD